MIAQKSSLSALEWEKSENNDDDGGLSPGVTFCAMQPLRLRCASSQWRAVAL